MYIKSMVLEGFKSYGKRIEINGFDKEFNAITGFNGSGKSNILDAICFVLGISNLSQVRATSLQELVYKHGQAGIQKATVTIIFDNHDQSSSPIGYESYKEIIITRQVIMGGKNKYMINGVTVPNKRVQDLFCSVQLNVNNPHFLIMQGRITKVLNMKPIEILSMIEEAAGTSMYETKKQTSLKIIEKKDSKLQQINTILNEQIKPKLDKLQQEKMQYVEFQRIQRELEICRRVCIAWKYMTALDNSNKAVTDVQDIENKIREKQQTIISGEEEIKEIENKLVELNKQRDQESGGKLEELEHNLKEANKVHLQLVAKSNSNKEDIKASEKIIKQLKANIVEEENMLLEKSKKFDQVGGIFQKLKEEEKKDSEALVAAQEMYQKISSGLLQTSDGDNATLEQQLINAKNLISQAQTELQQCQMTLNHNKNQLTKKLQDMSNSEDEYKKDNKVLELKEKELKNIENQLKKMNYKEGYLENIQNQKHSLQNEIKLLQDKLDQFECQYPQLRFNYKDPEPNFNRKSVKGLVCTLLSVKDKKAAYALDLAAGSKLYNVIVDTEITSKKILQKGELQQRVTIIPLNKINGRPMDKQTVEFAQMIGGKENVQPALSLIHFPEETRPVMNWIFGQIFICKDMETAKKIAFHKNIMKKCVTIEGDVLDPAGTLSGGAPSKTGSILLKLEELKEIENSLEQKRRTLKEIVTNIVDVHKKAEEFTSLKEKFDLQSFEISIVKQRLEQTTHHQIKQEVESLKKNIDDLNQRIIKAKQVEKENTIKAKEIEHQLKDAANILEKQLKEAEKRLAMLKEKSTKSRGKWQEHEQESKTLELEIEGLKKAIESEKEQLQTEEEKLNVLKESEQNFKQELENANDVIQNCQQKVQEQKQIIRKQNKDITELNEKKESIITQKEEIELDLKKLIHEINSIKKLSEDCKHKISEFIQKYKWIEEDKKYFGKAGGLYDFTTNKPEETSRKLQQLEVQYERLSRNVNSRAINLLDKEEEQYNEMIKKRKIVQNDKAKLITTIQHLDQKKEQTLLKAWKQVNKDFGSIFSSLLPGAEAKLQPLENKTLMDGLEVKIGFSGIWKESLGELSGGQRSLVALSLILAMLLFKPAPLYILDEVDAALDLSHTENIGIMLKRHFKHSQFIIVSLKDGMFNNANVLFTTKFVDGMSTVTRTEK